MARPLMSARVAAGSRLHLASLQESYFPRCEQSRGTTGVLGAARDCQQQELYHPSEVQGEKRVFPEPSEKQSKGGGCPPCLLPPLISGKG